MIEIYSKDGCKFCDMAKEFLDERCMTYTVIKQFDIESMKEKTGSRTFPFIFEDGEFIGGFRELMEKYDF